MSSSPLFFITLFSLAPMIAVMSYLVLAARLSPAVGAVSHSSLGGIGIAIMLSSLLHYSFSPLWGAALWSLCLAIALGAMALKKSSVSSEALSAVWVIGMALGLILYSLFNSGSTKGLDKYLFGVQALSFSSSYYIVSFIGCWLITGTAAALFRPFLASLLPPASFPAETARPLVFLFYVLVCMSIVLTVSFLGVVLIIAFFSFPILTALLFTKRPLPIIALSTALILLSLLIGSLGESRFSVAIGAISALCSAALYLTGLLTFQLKKRLSVRRHPTAKS